MRVWFTKPPTPLKVHCILCRVSSCTQNYIASQTRIGYPPTTAVILTQMPGSSARLTQYRQARIDHKDSKTDICGHLTVPGRSC